MQRISLFANDSICFFSFGGDDFSRPGSAFDGPMPAPSMDETFQPIPGTSGTFARFSTVTCKVLLS